MEQNFKIIDPEYIYFPCYSKKGQVQKLNFNIGDSISIGDLIYVDIETKSPLYSPVSGKIIGVEKRFNSSIGRPIDHIIIKNNKNNHYSKRTISKYSKTKILSLLKESGIIDRNNNHFSTLSLVTAESIVLNFADEDFYSFSSEEIQNIMDNIIKTFELIQFATNAKKLILITSKNNAKILNFSEKYTNLLKICIRNKKEIFSNNLIKNAILSSFKVNEDNFVFVSFSAAYDLSNCLQYGEKKIFQLIKIKGDAIKHNGVCVCPLGTPLTDIINAFGGYTSNKISLINGNLYSGEPQMKDEYIIEKGLNEINIIKANKKYNESCANCGRCSKCCPLGLQPVQIMKAFKYKNVNTIEQLQVNLCNECGLCSSVCPSAINLLDFIKKAKLQLKIKEAKK